MTAEVYLEDYRVRHIFLAKINYNVIRKTINKHENRKIKTSNFRHEQ